MNKNIYDLRIMVIVILKMFNVQLLFVLLVVEVFFHVDVFVLYIVMAVFVAIELR